MYTIANNVGVSLHSTGARLAFYPEVLADMRILNVMMYTFLEPWVAADNDLAIVNELQKEINHQHPLFGEFVELVGRSLQTDDYLFKIPRSSLEYCVVHLTWTGCRETSPDVPAVTFYKSWETFSEKVMKPLHQEYLD